MLAFCWEMRTISSSSSSLTCGAGRASEVLLLALTAESACSAALITARGALASNSFFNLCLSWSLSLDSSSLACLPSSVAMSIPRVRGSIDLAICLDSTFSSPTSWKPTGGTFWNSISVAWLTLRFLLLPPNLWSKPAAFNSLFFCNIVRVRDSSN